MICLTDISFIYEQCDLHNTDLRIWNRVYKRKTCQGSCDRDRIRTCDRLLRRQMLYPAELRDLYYFI